MKTFTNSEYLALITKLADQQYDDPEEEVNTSHIEWIPAEPEIVRKKLIDAKDNSSVDLLKYNREQIKLALTKHRILQIGKISVRIHHHLEDHCDTLEGIFFNFSVYHEVNRTPSGAPAKLTVSLDVKKDTRFTDQPWLVYFQGNKVRKMPLNSLLSMIRFFQVAQTLTAFL